MSGATKPDSSASIGILHFFRFLRAENDQITNRLFVIGTLSGLAQAFAVGIVVYVSEQRGLERGVQFQSVILFGLVLIAAFKLRQYTLHRTAEIVENTMHNVRLRFVDKIRQASLADFELIKNSTLYTALTTNAQTISQSSAQIVNSASSGIMVIFSGLIIAYISPLAFFVIFGGIAAGGILITRGRKQLQIEVANAVEKEKKFFGGLNDLLLGFKELKINDKKCEAFFAEVLAKEIEETRDLKTDTAKTFANATVFGGIFFFLILGSVLFILPLLDPEVDKLVPGLISVAIFTMSPMLELIATNSLVAQANAAIDHLKEVEGKLDNAVEAATLSGACGKAKTSVGFEELEMSDVQFTYAKTGSYAPFHFGPANFKLKKGELVFVVGANGSGKTTFLKLLTGLYYPDSGKMLLDGERLADSNIGRYRNQFSTIFSDFHLFDQIFGLDEIDENEVSEFLDLTGMKNVTSIENGRITNLSLSTGQRKRIGLVCALLEKRPILIFDELAADQDPSFRKYVYEKIFPDLAKKDVTIVAASHDDQYFDMADRVIKIEGGTIRELEDRKWSDS